MIEDICLCDGYVYWYVEVDISVCRCGHPRSEHVEELYICTGTTYKV